MPSFPEKYALVPKPLSYIYNSCGFHNKHTVLILTRLYVTALLFYISLIRFAKKSNCYYPARESPHLSPQVYSKMWTLGSRQLVSIYLYALCRRIMIIHIYFQIPMVYLNGHRSTCILFLFKDLLSTVLTIALQCNANFLPEVFQTQLFILRYGVYCKFPTLRIPRNYLPISISYFYPKVSIISWLAAISRRYEKTLSQFFNSRFVQS